MHFTFIFNIKRVSRMWRKSFYLKYYSCRPLQRPWWRQQPPLPPPSYNSYYRSEKHVYRIDGKKNFLNFIHIDLGTTVILYDCTTVRLYYCTIVLLYDCMTVLLHYCTMYYCTIVLLYECTTVRLYYCTTVRLYYCTTV